MAQIRQVAGSETGWLKPFMGQFSVSLSDVDSDPLKLLLQPFVGFQGALNAVGTILRKDELDGTFARSTLTPEEKSKAQAWLNRWEKLKAAGAEHSIQLPGVGKSGGSGQQLAWASDNQRGGAAQRLQQQRYASAPKANWMLLRDEILETSSNIQILRKTLRLDEDNSAQSVPLLKLLLHEAMAKSQGLEGRIQESGDQKKWQKRDYQYILQRYGTPLIKSEAENTALAAQYSSNRNHHQVTLFVHPDFNYLEWSRQAGQEPFLIPADRPVLGSVFVQDVSANNLNHLNLLDAKDKDQLKKFQSSQSKNPNVNTQLLAVYWIPGLLKKQTEFSALQMVSREYFRVVLLCLLSYRDDDHFDVLFLRRPSMKWTTGTFTPFAVAEKAFAKGQQRGDDDEEEDEDDNGDDDDDDEEEDEDLDEDEEEGEDNGARQRPSAAEGAGAPAPALATEDDLRKLRRANALNQLNKAFVRIPLSDATQGKRDEQRGGGGAVAAPYRTDAQKAFVTLVMALFRINNEVDSKLIKYSAPVWMKGGHIVWREREPSIKKVDRTGAPNVNKDLLVVGKDERLEEIMDIPINDNDNIDIYELAAEDTDSLPK